MSLWCLNWRLQIFRTSAVVMRMPGCSTKLSLCTKRHWKSVKRCYRQSVPSWRRVTIEMKCNNESAVLFRTCCLMECCVGITAMDNLSRCYRRQGRLNEESMELAKKALEMATSFLPSHNLQLGMCKNTSCQCYFQAHLINVTLCIDTISLAECYRDANQTVSSIELYERAVDIFKQHLPLQASLLDTGMFHVFFMYVIAMFIR